MSVTVVRKPERRVSSVLSGRKRSSRETLKQMKVRRCLWHQTHIEKPQKAISAHLFGRDNASRAQLKDKSQAVSIVPTGHIE
jgi:hypothetical protein